MNIQIRKALAFAYRKVGLVLMSSFLIGVIAFIFVEGLYVTNSDWVVPITVSPSNDKILDLTAKIISSEQTLESTQLDADRLEQSLDLMRPQRKQLQLLKNKISMARQSLSLLNQASESSLNQLSERKISDNLDASAIDTSISELKSQAKRDLVKGLITKADYITILTSSQQFHNNATDGEISSVLLMDNVLEKSGAGIKFLDAMSREADLTGQIYQLDIAIQTGSDQLQTDKLQVVRLKKAIRTAKESPYFLVTQGNTTNFAFVPYDNTKNAKVGTKIFDCYLNLIVCRQVGVIKHMFTDEERGSHPIFHTDMRGNLAELELTNSSSFKSRTLFVHRKPLFF